MLGDHLKKLRGKRTQEEVAKLLGISRARYSHYENGVRQPDFNTLEQIANFYNVTTDYLLGRNIKENKDPLSELTTKDELDIGKRMAKIRKDLLEGISDDDKTSLSFMGEPMSEEAVESLLEALEHAERLATLANKKYIPKKYRKD